MIESLEDRRMFVAKPDAIAGFNFNFAATEATELFEDSGDGRFDFDVSGNGFLDVDIEGDGPNDRGTYRYVYTSARGFERVVFVTFPVGNDEVTLNFELHFDAIDRGSFRVQFSDESMAGTFHLTPQSGRGTLRGRVMVDALGDENAANDTESLSGIRVFLDRNGDGRWNRTREISRFSDENGYYVFKNLPAGFYNVRCGVLDSYRVAQPAGAAHIVALSPGEVGRGMDFSQTRTSRLESFTFRDLDQNSRFDTGEDRSGGRVYLDLNDNGQFDLGDPRDAANDRGFQVLRNLPAGTYKLRFIPNVDSGSLTAPAEGYYLVRFKAGSIMNGFTFVSR